MLKRLTKLAKAQTSAPVKVVSLDLNAMAGSLYSLYERRSAVCNSHFECNVFDVLYCYVFPRQRCSKTLMKDACQIFIWVVGIAILIMISSGTASAARVSINFDVMQQHHENGEHEEEKNDITRWKKDVNRGLWWW